MLIADIQGLLEQANVEEESVLAVFCQLIDAYGCELVCAALETVTSTPAARAANTLPEIS